MGISDLMSEISDAPKELSKLMKQITVKDKKAFKNVLRGFPENQVNSYKGDLGVVYLKKINFEDDFDQIPRPESLDIILGMICKGTKTIVHDKIVDLNLIVLEKFITDPNWKTLNNTVKLASINKHEIYIEQSKNSLLTTSIYEITCELKYHETEDTGELFEEICNTDTIEWGEIQDEKRKKE